MKQLTDDVRVAVVGGAGAMGQVATSVAAGFPEVDEVVVLDRDHARADSLAQQLGPKVSARRFDVEADNLIDSLDGCAAVVNTLGPFARFGTRVMVGAISAGCHYVDINDDWEPTVDALELGGAASDAGVTALIGMGLSPGISNVLAARAAHELDSVSEMMTGWSLAATRSEPGGQKPSAAMTHLVHQCTGRIRVVQGGESCLTRPLERIQLPYPGIGLLEARSIGHPEPTTLPLTFTNLRRCQNLMVGPAWWFDHLAAVMARVDSGELTANEAAMIMEEPLPRPSDAPRTPRTPPAWGWARGESAGRPTIAVAGINRWPEGLMAGATAIPAVIALRMILRGEIVEHGVVTPESAVPFETLMEHLAPMYTLPDDHDGLALVTVSTEELGP